VLRDYRRSVGQSVSQPAEAQIAFTRCCVCQVCSILGAPERAAWISEDNPAGNAIWNVLNLNGAIPASEIVTWWLVQDVATELTSFMNAEFPGFTLIERHGEYGPWHQQAFQLAVSAAAAQLLTSCGVANAAAACADRTFRFKLPRVGAAASLAAVFGNFERAKERLQIQECAAQNFTCSSSTLARSRHLPCYLMASADAAPVCVECRYGVSETTLEQIFNNFAGQQEEETGAVRGLIAQNAATSAEGIGGSE
jgi:hypothetical protein